MYLFVTVSKYPGCKTVSAPSWGGFSPQTFDCVWAGANNLDAIRGCEN